MDRRSFLKNSGLLFLATGFSSKIPGTISGAAAAREVQRTALEGQGEIKNIAFSKKVLFAPQPNYGATSKNGTNEFNLTDGKIIQIDNSPNATPWTDPAGVGWKYDSNISRVNLSIDLGEICKISHVAMRFLQRKIGFYIPGWIEMWVSDDGATYRKIVEKSRWDDPEIYQGKDSAVSSPEAQMTKIQLTAPENIHGRYVGLRMSIGQYMIADELYIYGNKDPEEPVTNIKDGDAWGGFSITEPQPYFHKPKLIIPSNITTPQVMGMVIGQKLSAKGNLRLEFDLPPEISWDAPEPASKSTLSDGWERIRLDVINPSYTRMLLRFFLRAKSANKSGHIRWRYFFDGKQLGELTVPFSTTSVKETPAPKRMETIGFGWWKIEDSIEWPNVLDSFQHLGLNAISVYGTSSSPHWVSPKNEKVQIDFLKEARRRGIKIFAADSTYNAVAIRARTNPSQKEVFCQFADGSTNKNLCPSYRGKYYQEELERFASYMVQVQPDYVNMDIEPFTSASKKDARHKCTRCITDYKGSGIKDWNDWWYSKTSEMIRNMVDMSRKKLEENGANPEFIASVYAAERGAGIHPPHYFRLADVYPEYLQCSNPYYYTPTYPYNILSIAEMVRQNRELFQGIWQLLTPGDDGPIPGAAFKWSILESYCNGARGVLFWSQRGWDAEYLIAYSDAIRAIVPVEDIIIDGELIGDIASVSEHGHLSGMKQGNRMVLLISDYMRASGGNLQLSIQLNIPAKMRDLETGEIIRNHLPAGKQIIPIDLQGKDARLVEVRSL